MAIRLIAIGLACALGLQAAVAAELVGRVVAITDGDTLTILDAGRRQHKVRIAGIDAPEKRQPWGERSRQHMANLAFGKSPLADCYKKSYERQVCRVYVAGADVGLAQVAAGLAWWYRKYANEQTAEDRGRYEAAEQEARSRRLGLWADPQPVPPWEWRAARRRK